MLSQGIPRSCLSCVCTRKRTCIAQQLVQSNGVCPFIILSHSLLLLFTCSPQQLVLCSFLSLLQQLQALTAWLLQSKTDDEAMTSQHIVDGFYDEDEDDDAAAAFSLGAGIVPEDVAACQSKQTYIDSGNDKKVLFMLSIGLWFNSDPLFSVDEEPWSTLPKTMLRPRNNDFVSEVLRRAKEINMISFESYRAGNRVDKVKGDG